MTKLKTLNDIGNPSDGILNPIKEVIQKEAIKWVKELEKKMEGVKGDLECREHNYLCGQRDFAKEFHNITEDDLK